jgi:hypothetical protein
MVDVAVAQRTNTTLWYNAYEPKAPITISGSSVLAFPGNRRIGDGLIPLVRRHRRF